MPIDVSNSRQRILALWLRRLSTDRLRRQSREGNGKAQPFASPCVIFAKQKNADRLVAVNDAAEALGLHVGIALAEARAMYPALVAEPEDARADAALLDAIADWCTRYTPLVATDLPDGLLLDISGCAHLFGGEEALLKDLVARLTRFGFAVRAAIASTIGAAWAAAHFSATAALAPGSERDAIAPLPLAALRLDDDMVAVLARVGLKRVADIIDLPRSPLAARFGDTLLRQLDRALGREREPLNPRMPVPPYFSEKPFAEPIAREEDVLAAVLRLARRLAVTLEQRGEGARAIELTLFRTDGAVRRIAAGTSRPLRDPLAIRKLFVERLAALGDELDPGFGFDLARLSILAAEPLPPEQVGLGTPDDAAEIDGLVDRLAARLGRRRITRIVAQDSHIPELAASPLPAQLSIAQRENGWEAFREYRTAAALAPRPLRLLTKPERIAVTPMMVDAPPIKFQWRRAWHEVVAADGPERIEAAWWNDEEGRARDYFRVEDRVGLRFWLFRAGLYRDVDEEGRPLPPLWFMHGLFA